MLLIPAMRVETILDCLPSLHIYLPWEIIYGANDFCEGPSEQRQLALHKTKD